MKKLIAGIMLLVSFQSHALVGSALTGGWATYFYVMGGAAIGVDTVCIINPNSKICDAANYDGGVISQGMGLLIGALALGEDQKIATFPKLSKEIIDNYNLEEEQVKSYHNDLTKLRLSTAHLGSSAKIETEEDLIATSEKIDRVLKSHFSRPTIQVVEAIRDYNSQKLRDIREAQ